MKYLNMNIFQFVWVLPECVCPRMMIFLENEVGIGITHLVDISTTVSYKAIFILKKPFTRLQG